MSDSTLIIIFLSAIVSIALAGFQYFRKSKKNFRYSWILAFLKAAAIFSMLLLLINPGITSTFYYSEKPNLLVAVDNSASMSYSGEGSRVHDFVDRVTSHSRIREKFDIHTYTFGRELRSGNTFKFFESQTNIQAALKDLNDIYKNSLSPTILITDGHQTFGANFLYEAQKYKNPLLPVIVGDTTTHEDLSLSRVNVNKYAFLKNKFPVEIITNYSGEEPIKADLRIFNGNFVLYSKELSFNKIENSQVTQAFLTASNTGVLKYRAEIVPFKGEQNKENNLQNFGVEVIDERTNVLVISSLSHPDLGALKRSIETNEQREVEIVNVDEIPEDLDSFELLILYQPTVKFKRIWESIKTEMKNHWIITGPETDWNFLNQMQEDFQRDTSGQTEDFFPILNHEFSAFQLQDIGYSQFPPLKGTFGDFTEALESEVILYQQIQGIQTDYPLMTTVETEGWRRAYLFGADLWKWRSQVFSAKGSFEAFDDFIGKLVQYLASTQKRERITIDHDNIYNGNENIVITAQYFDENLNFDPRGELILKLKNLMTNEVQVFPLRLSKNEFQVNISGIPPADYSYQVSDKTENISKRGNFSVIDFEIEKQFSSANYLGLHQLAVKKNSRVFFPGDPQPLIDSLLIDNNYSMVQKSRQKHVSLIDWYYLLAVTVFFLSAEWFFRKYLGLI